MKSYDIWNLHQDNIELYSLSYLWCLWVYSFVKSVHLNYTPKMCMLLCVNCTSVKKEMDEDKGETRLTIS